MFHLRNRVKIYGRMIKILDSKKGRTSKVKPFFFNYFYLTMLGLSCSVWDLVPWPGNEPGPPALGAQRLSHRPTTEVPVKPS